MRKIKILVCCHKQTERLHDDIFTPILLGSEFADEALKQAFKNDFWDNMGDNIGRLHPWCAELTAIYWAWKNYDRLGDPEYIGLHHYRRFFNYSDPLPETDNWKCAFFDFDRASCNRFGWDREKIEAFCEGQELMLPLSEQITDPHDWVTPADLETHYKHSHYPEDLDTASALICQLHPDYAGAVDAALHSGEGHFCNMFIMSKALFFDYAQWLFSIILPLEELLPVSDPKYKGEQKRVLGFLGERLFNVWITKKLSEGVKLRETQRLTGYLTEADKAHYQKTYGLDEYTRALTNSKRFDVKNSVFDPAINADNVVVHPARSTETPLVSILVPVYNVGPFLRECCESLVHQTLQNIEIVFVNDASKDNSRDILWEYYQKDPRIVLIDHKENEGLPCARNTALRYMHGAYFSCIDSDDVCDLTMFEKMYRKAVELGADIVTCSVFGFFDNINEVYYHRQLEWYGDSDRLLSLKGRPQQLMEPAAWCKLFRTDYIKSLDYFEFRPKTRSWEDVPAMTSAFCQTDKIATVQEALYFYRQRREGNISSSMTKRNTDEFISGAILQQAILDKHHFFDEEVQSYIEEFKFLFAEWSLTKMAKKDIPYFFHRVPSLFKKENKHYLQRVFTLYPHRKRFYTVMMTRSAALYYAARFGYHTLARLVGGVKKVGRGIKPFIKRLFNIRREDVYWAFGYGFLTVRIFRKSYYRQTMAWYQERVRERDWLNDNCNRLNAALNDSSAHCRELENKTVLLLREAEERSADRKLLSAQNRELEQQFALLREKTEELSADMEQLSADKEQLSARNQELSTALTLAEQARELSDRERALLTETNAKLSETNVSLDNANSRLLEANSQMLRSCEALNESFQAAAREKESMTEENHELRSACEQQVKALEERQATIDSFVKEFDGYYHAVWATGWIRVWKQYYYENYASIPQRTERLTEGLDSLSAETVRLLCKRNFELLPTQENTELFRYNHNLLYTPAELRGAKEAVDFTRERQRFSIPEDLEMETSVWRFHCGLRALPKGVVESLRGKAVIDGGAYWGDSALVFSQYGPAAIYAFEPQAETFDRLREVVERNDLTDRIFPQRMGLSDKPGESSLYTRDIASGANLFDIAPVGGEDLHRVDRIDLTSIDEFMKDKELPVGLIKLDVEGNESQVIAGAMETIRRDKPVLAISIYHTPRDFFDIKPLLEQEGLGYRFLIRKLSFHDLVTEVMLLGYAE